MASNTSDEMDNTMRVYLVLQEEMMTKRRHGGEEEVEQAERTAHILLGHADLPIMIRARACMVLGYSTEPDCVDYAREGVRIVEAALAFIVEEGEEPGPADYSLLRRCQRTLRDAEQYVAGLEQNGDNPGDEGEEEEGEHEQEEDGHGEDEDEEGLEVVWTEQDGWLNRS